MSDRRVVAFKCLPATLPLHGGLTLWLLLDRWHAPLSTQAIVWAIYAIGFALEVYRISTQDEHDPFRMLK